MSSGSVNRRLGAVFTLGFLTGLAAAYGLARWFEGRFLKSEGGVHKLTADIAPEELYAFRDSPGGGAPLVGVIKAGSEYQVRARKGMLSYISFRTVIPTNQLQAVSGPLIIDHVSSLGTDLAASSTSQLAAGLPNNALQRTRFARR